MSRAVSKGIHAARPPYGLRPVREIEKGKVNISWELDPEEAPIVREMLRRYTKMLADMASGEDLTELEDDN